MKKKSSVQLYALGAVIRYWLMTSGYQNYISDCVELSTPTNSWKRITEGLFLSKLNINPYSGDILHESPLNLRIFEILMSTFRQHFHMVFILSDVITAGVLYFVAKKYIINELRNGEERDSVILANYCSAFYLFNPYSILNCVACTTTTFNNLFLSLYFLGLTSGNLILTTFALAYCTSQNFYFVLLTSPLLIQFYRTKPSCILSSILFGAFFVGCSYFLQNDWQFLESTHGFAYFVPDFRPNIGLFWYIFMVMFDHFASFFIFVFQANATFFYLIPLSIFLRDDSVMLSTCLVFLITIFKSYPCLGEVGFVLSLLLCWNHLWEYFRLGFFTSYVFLLTNTLAPNVLHLWLYGGSANINFYFGATLGFTSAEVFLFIDWLVAHAKYKFMIKNGLKLEEGNVLGFED